MAGLAEASGGHGSPFRMDYGSRDEQNGVGESPWGKEESEGLENICEGRRL